MKSVQRFHSNARMSQVVRHNGVLYLAGQVALSRSLGVGSQTREILQRIDDLLAEQRSDKKHILSATIWLASIEYFAEFNEVWDDWVDSTHTPARACVEAKLALPDFLVEIGVVAACAPVDDDG